MSNISNSNYQFHFFLFFKLDRVTSGQTDLSHYNIISGHQLPEQLIICLTEQTSYDGNIRKNPFNFKHLDISEASIVVNGVHEPSEVK